ncbi:hypothetical protein BP354E_6156 [Burkholderia pseudomallei 354e]|uniref:Uncharacterized protein n=1 Tax=Burkholderia pseudomallei (strain 1026b) TaxID=884204 RepID=A0A0H3HQ88_BURP2|nr:hypothetical protein BP1026B_II0137 [Burkholderia pseudomallei 1026b]EIF63416.1 hypothetical protein BP1026A_1826 [Burkholderia pseudomallei 1026a]EIF68412.1 hypothetical protein BP354E_6156 [Burkholderia pseudomallei 354e]EIF79327.1 hypothetical protein BP354A_3433 [Burkholderia pseudomallei 354a]
MHPHAIWQTCQNSIIYRHYRISAHTLFIDFEEAHLTNIPLASPSR